MNAASAMPMGIPGCPDFAFSTASSARKRIVLIASCSRLTAFRGGAMGFMALHPWARVVGVRRIVRKAFAARQRYHGAVQALILAPETMMRICEHLFRAFPEE